MDEHFWPLADWGESGTMMLSPSASPRSGGKNGDSAFGRVMPLPTRFNNTRKRSLT